jgi:hypothetical protein
VFGAKGERDEGKRREEKKPDLVQARAVEPVGASLAASVGKRSVGDADDRVALSIRFRNDKGSGITYQAIDRRFDPAQPRHEETRY